MLPIPEPPTQAEIDLAKQIIELERQNLYSGRALGVFGSLPGLPGGS